MTEQQTEQQTVEAVHRSVTVEAPIEDCWVVFTAHFRSWWPHKTHSLGREQVEAVVMEPRIGGRLYERHDDGTEKDWGRVVGWDPPYRLTVEWDLAGDDDDPPTEWEARFTADGDRTLVEIEHRGFEQLATRGPESRASHDGGWPRVLAAYVAAVR
jgi:uncharacterized protein YndB with AHSA1/START domain